jgi:hypothetical protein
MANKKSTKEAKNTTHPKNCDCTVCANARANERVKLWQLHGAAAPLDPNKTVFVRSFWRHQKNHFNKLPNSRNALVARLRALARAVRR